MTSVYQPIVGLETGVISWVEALCRPVGIRPNMSVEQFFRDASRSGTIRDLDWQCRRSAIVNAVGLPPEVRLCVKLELGATDSPQADADRMVGIAEVCERTAQSIVLEVMVGNVLDPARLRALGIYREAGFPIAVDGVPTASVAQSIVTIVKPAMLKIDRSVTRSLGSPARASDIRNIVAAAARCGAAVIAQGIETEDQAHAYHSHGVEFGQGYYLGRPEALSALRMSPHGDRSDD